VYYPIGYGYIYVENDMHITGKYLIIKGTSYVICSMIVLRTTIVIDSHLNDVNKVMHNNVIR
jgi:hypothetical protein